MEGRRRLLYSGSSREKSQEYVKTEWRAGSPNEKERKLRRDLEVAERKTCGCGRAVGEIFKECKPGFAFGPGQIDSLLHWHTGHHTALCDTHTPPPDPQGGTELGWRGRHHRKLFFSPLPLLGEGALEHLGAAGPTTFSLSATCPSVVHKNCPPNDWCASSRCRLRHIPACPR